MARRQPRLLAQGQLMGAEPRKEADGRGQCQCIWTPAAAAGRTPKPAGSWRGEPSDRVRPEESECQRLGNPSRGNARQSAGECPADARRDAPTKLNLQSRWGTARRRARSPERRADARETWGSRPWSDRPLRTTPTVAWDETRPLRAARDETWPPRRGFYGGTPPPRGFYRGLPASSNLPSNRRCRRHRGSWRNSTVTGVQTLCRGAS